MCQLNKSFLASCAILLLFINPVFSRSHFPVHKDSIQGKRHSTYPGLFSKKKIRGNGSDPLFDHTLIQEIGVGGDLYNYDMKLDPIVYPPNGEDEGGIGGSLAVLYGINMPLLPFLGDLGTVGVNASVCTGLGDGLLTYRFPIYGNIRIGSGSSKDCEDEYSFGAGLGLTFQGARFMGNFEYMYIQPSPSIMLEAGYSYFILRIEYTVLQHHVDFNAHSYGDFKNFNFSWIIYLHGREN